MHPDEEQLRAYIRDRFTSHEWITLMAAVHKEKKSVADDKISELRRRYWRLHKAKSRWLRRTKRLADPGFQDWLKRRGLPMDVYKHAHYRDYMIDKGEKYI